MSIIKRYFRTFFLLSLGSGKCKKANFIFVIFDQILKRFFSCVNKKKGAWPLAGQYRSSATGVAVGFHRRSTCPCLWLFYFKVFLSMARKASHRQLSKFDKGKEELCSGMGGMLKGQIQSKEAMGQRGEIIWTPFVSNFPSKDKLFL